MSWEGYYQLICKNRHYWTEDACYREISDCFCPECKGRAKYWNQVDLTNGSFDDKGHQIDGYVKMTPKKINRCKTCHHPIETKWKIPKLFTRVSFET